MSELLTDPREIRKHLHLAAYRGARIGPQAAPERFPSSASSLARNCLRMGEAMGYSGEDTMTALAYHALVQLERVTDLMLAEAALRPSPGIVLASAQK